MPIPRRFRRVSALEKRYGRILREYQVRQGADLYFPHGFKDILAFFCLMCSWMKFCMISEDVKKMQINANWEGEKSHGEVMPEKLRVLLLGELGLH